MDILSMKLIKVSYKYIWLWCVAIEPTNKQIVQSDISFERTMLIVAEHFISSLIYKYGKHLVSTEMVAVLGIHLNLASFWNSNIIFILLIREIIFIERTIQYIKYRTENFDDYFPCIRRKKKCKLKHVRKWSNLFAYYYNRGISA